jgi:NAD(P)-dependent dehydrogenase (short-subunit alcohol dehydrogenase family)
MDTGLKGKNALVTGGSTGVGRGIALALANEGVHIAVASRNPDPRTMEEIQSRGVRALRLRIDVSREDQVIAMVQQTVQGLGGLDLYVNNAAAHWDEPAMKLTTEGWLNSIHTNLSACVWACREIGRHFISQGHGSILIIGSGAAGHPLYKETSYRVSKMGLKMYMEVLAIELAPFGIRVNMITPGYFRTKVASFIDPEMEKTLLKTIPLRRDGNAEEDIGPAAALLLSDKLSPYTTGANWVIDGGGELRPLAFYSDEEIRQMSLQAPGMD